MKRNATNRQETALAQTLAPSGDGAADPCLICGALLGNAPQVCVAGGAVHIGCADREAETAWRTRQILAIRDLVVVVGVVALLWLFTQAVVLVGVGLLGGCSFHGIRHRRFWYYVRRDLLQRVLRQRQG